MDQRPVYLDGHATTPLAHEAAEAMAPWWSIMAANAHSPHAFGQRAATAVEGARREIADLVGAAPSEVIFTSGATEANNLALLGVAQSAASGQTPRKNIVVSAIEHKSVLAAAAELGNRGWEIRISPVDRSGRLDVDVFASMVDENTLLASVMVANNEVGTIQPVSDVISICRDRGALVHVDAAQAVGKMPVCLADVDYASISSHKMYGPVGVGALFVSSAATYRPRPLFFGGDQEGGLRPGTLPVPLIVGFGVAAKLRNAVMVDEANHVENLRGRFLRMLEQRQVQFSLNGHTTERLPGSISIQLEQHNALDLIMRLGDRVLVADGSACSSGNILPSHVLTAMGLSDIEATSSVRMYISRHITETGIEIAADEIALATGGPRQ